MKENKKPTKTDLSEIDKLSDQDIDYSDIPELDESFFREAKLVKPQTKESLTVRYDKEVVDFFKQHVGKGYQSKMNAVLKAYVRHEKKRKTG